MSDINPNSANEDELDLEERQLREEAESIDPKRPEDDQIQDDTTADRASRSEKPNSKNKDRAASDKSAAAATDKADTSKAAEKSQATDPKQTDKSAAADKPTTKPGAEDEDESKLTPYQRDQRRLARNRKEFEEEKAREREAIRKEREALEAERRAAREQTTAKPKITRDPNAPTSADYEQVAADFEAEGKVEQAKRARAKAAELKKVEEQEAAGEPAKVAPAVDTEAQKKEWADNLAKLGEQYPELTQEKSPLRARVAKLLKEEPVFHTTGKGILFAVEAARLLGEVETYKGQVAEKDQRIASLEKEIQRLNELTAIPAAGATAGTGTTKRFEEMSLEEQEEAIRRDAVTAGRD